MWLRSERCKPADERRFTVDLQIIDGTTRAYYNLTGAVNNAIWREKREPPALLELRSISTWMAIRHTNPYF